jgi:serralysin
MTIINEVADAADGIATTYSMESGDYFFGSLDATDSNDWIEVTLVAGQTYTFGLVGTGALNDSINDTVLRLHDAAGNEIAINDDVDFPDFPFSNLTFTAATSGTYYLDASSFSGTETGTYGLSMTFGDRASYDVVMGAGVLIRPDLSWSAIPGGPVSVSWAIRTSGSATDAQGNPVAFEAVTAGQTAAIAQIMAMFDGISGLSLTQNTPGGTSNDATILFGGYTSTTDGAGAYANFPGSTASANAAGDVWLNNDSVNGTSLPEGSYSYFAIMHEVGHAMGLAHPGPYNAGPGVSITYANNAEFIQDSHQYTVMSYFDESNTTSNLFSYPDTLMLYDIYALHELYGADYGYHAGDSIYGFNSNLGGAFDFTTNTDPLLCIWDGSGSDTLDVSGFGMDQYLDLREGLFSDIGGFQGNVSIAIGAVIEDAIGGAGADTIFGNDSTNRLNGGNGADTIYGNAKKDYLFGEGDEDSLYGGGGNDRLKGGGQSDDIFGDGGNDKIFGGSGKDVLEGGKGDDELTGGNGADDFIFANGFGNDTIMDFDANNNGEDINLSAVTSIKNFNDLLSNHMVQNGLDVLITAAGGNTITLLNVDINDLDRADFIF